MHLLEENARVIYLGEKFLKEELKHRFVMFLTIDNDKELTSKFIKSVTYYLHPGYKINRIKV